MHAILRGQITIGKATLSRMHSVVIKDSISSITNTCIIKVPTQMVLKKDGELITEGLTYNQIKTGDEVIVNLWYNDDKRNVDFHGFVKRINPNQPVEIECEDWAYLLRFVNMKKTFVKSTIKTVLTELLGMVKNYPLSLANDCDDIPFDSLTVAGKLGEQLNGMQVLQFIKDRFGLVTNFDSFGVLYVGLRYKRDLGIIKYVMGKNTIRKECNLKYCIADDIKMKIKCVFIGVDGIRTEATVGDETGSERTVILYNISDKTHLEQLAQNELKRFKYDGYQGTIKSFLQPQITSSNTINLVDEKYPDRNGKYFCESVTTEFTTNGARRTITLGPKLSA